MWRAEARSVCIQGWWEQSQHHPQVPSPLEHRVFQLIPCCHLTLVHDFGSFLNRPYKWQTHCLELVPRLPLTSSLPWRASDPGSVSSPRCLSVR